MSLADLRLPKARVEVSEDQFFEVRGLGFHEIGLLVSAHGALMAGLFVTFKERAEKGLTEVDTASIGQTIAERAPDLFVDIIAMAAGGIAFRDVAMQLPLPVQMDALDKIITQTFKTEAQVKKVLEIVIKGSTSFGRTIESLNSP